MTMTKNKIMYHISLSKNMLTNISIAIMPGDPARVELLAKLFDKNATPLAQNREYTSFIANVGNKKILVISTGIGGPSVGLCVEELAMLGIKKFIRVGTSGSIQSHVNIGDIVVSTAAVRLEGTSIHYAPLEYPAVASLDINIGLKNSIKKLKNESSKCFFGLTASSDTFFPGQERTSGYGGYVCRKFQHSIKEWRNLKVINFEMESASLFTIVQTFGLEAGCISAVVAQRVESEEISLEHYDQSMQTIVDVLTDSIKNNFYQKKKIYNYEKNSHRTR